MAAIEWFTNTESWEWASYVVTVVGLPFAIGVFIFERRRERQNEDEELYQRLSDEYAEFSKLLLENADLGLMTHPIVYRQMTPEQLERRNILFDILVSLFERAYILSELRVLDWNMTRTAQKLGIERSHLYRKLKTYGITPPKG